MQAVGGFDTCLDGILRTTPDGWPVELVGSSGDVRARPIGKWLDLEFAGRPVRFLAALANPKTNRPSRLPLSLQFAVACRRRAVHASGRIVQYHRFESGLGVPAGSRQRCVYFLHNHPPEETRSTHNNVRWRHLRGIHDAILTGRLRQASLVVAVDPRTPGWVRSTFPALRDRVVALPQWADPSVFRLATSEERLEEAARLRADHGLPPDSKIVLFAGRLEPQKDPLLLARAFAQLAATRPEVFLLIVGEGEMRAAMDEAVRALGVAERVRWMSSVGRIELSAIYRACNVSACTSAFEGGPRTAFEALASGTPVVTLDVGQIGPVLKLRPEVGVLVREREERAFAAGLAAVLFRPADAELGHRCADAVRDHTPERALAGLFHQYRAWEDGRFV